MNGTTMDTLYDRIRAALRSAPHLGPRFRVDRLEIDAGGVLTLQGAAPSVAAKKEALERAAAFPEVTAVVDRLHVTPSAPMSDDGIRDHLRKFFTRDPAFAELVVRELRRPAPAPDAPADYALVSGDPAAARGEIDIEVRDGVVILNGRTPGLTSKRLAGVMAWWVPGVRDVVNGLEVDPPEEDAPILIEEAVALALERDPYVDASQIRVGVRDRVVRLTGYVPSAPVRAMAEQDAWCVFGVDRVINEIAVGR